MQGYRSPGTLQRFVSIHSTIRNCLSVAAFAQTHRLVVLDPRGHGKSSTTNSNNTYDQVGRDIHALLEHLGIDRCILGGWSAGVSACYGYFKAVGTDRVSHLIAIDQPPKPFSADERKWCVGDHEVWKGLYHTIVYDRHASTNGFCDWLTIGETNPNDLEWMVNQSMSCEAGAATNFITDLQMRDDTEIAKMVGQKVKLLNVVRADMAEVAKLTLAEEGIQSELHVLGAHMMFWEEHEAFNEVMSAFIDMT